MSIPMTNKQIAILTLISPFIIGGASSYSVAMYVDGSRDKRIENNEQQIAQHSDELKARAVHLPKILRIIDKEDDKEKVLKSLSDGIHNLNVLLARMDERDKSREAILLEGKRKTEELEDMYNELAIKVERITK
mgnify:CR=1 FL=1